MPRDITGAFPRVMKIHTIFFKKFGLPPNGIDIQLRKI